MNAENIDTNGCSQRDNAEHEGYAKAHRSFNSIWKERNSAQPELLEKILYKDNLNRTFKRVKANKGALLNLLRRNVKDERVIQWIKRYLKSGVMENGVVMETEEGSPQGGNISPLLANIYLNEFDQKYEKRGVKFIRYADDIVLLVKSDRAAKRLLETSTKYLEGTLKLKVNQEKSRVVSCLQSEILNTLALHWERTERVFISEFMKSHGRR